MSVSKGIKLILLLNFSLSNFYCLCLLLNPFRYLNSKKGEKLNELQEKHTQLQSDLHKSKERKEEKSAELSKNKELLKSQDQLKRNIDDNLNYRRTKDEVERLTHEIELLEDKILSIGSLSTIEADLKQHSQEKDRLLSEVFYLSFETTDSCI